MLQKVLLLSQGVSFGFVTSWPDEAKTVTQQNSIANCIDFHLQLVLGRCSKVPKTDTKIPLCMPTSKLKTYLSFLFVAENPFDVQFAMPLFCYVMEMGKNTPSLEEYLPTRKMNDFFQSKC